MVEDKKPLPESGGSRQSVPYRSVGESGRIFRPEVPVSESGIEPYVVLPGEVPKSLSHPPKESMPSLSLKRTEEDRQIAPADRDKEAQADDNASATIAKPVETEPEAPLRPLSDREVLAHTAALWKYKPVPGEDEEPEPYEEVLRESSTLGSFHVTAARVRGKKHKHEGTNCDDWFVTFGVEKFVVAIVSDGAGSKKFSRIGAKASCEGAKDFLEKELPRVIREEIDFTAALGRDVADVRFQHAAAQLARTAQSAVLRARESVVAAFRARRGDSRYQRVLGRELELSDFAATFLLTVALPLDGSQDTLVVTVQVGDGMIAAINTKAPYKEALTLLSQPDSGDFSGETEFLTGRGIDRIEALGGRTRLARKPVDLILSMTDGVADDYDPPETQLLRLYFDLKANRILDWPEMAGLLHQIEDRRSALAREVPAPQAYPGVHADEEQRLFDVQYTSELCEVCGLTLEELWEEKSYYLAVMASFIKHDGERSSASRLAAWLDHYVLRGSFDDRTLVILQRGDR